MTEFRTSRRGRSWTASHSLLLIALGSLAVLSGSEAKSRAGIGRVVGEFQLPVEARYRKEFPRHFDALAREAGWTRTASGFSRAAPLAGARLTDGMEVVVANDEGYFTYSGDPGRLRLELVGEKGSRPLSPKGDASLNGRGGAVWTLDIPIGSCCSGVGKEPEVQREGRSTCLDYNGPASDGRNYEWRYGGREGAKAVRNFIGSDCDFALRKCWREYTGEVKCVTNHGGTNCSRFIGHAPYYHRHRRRSARRDTGW